MRRHEMVRRVGTGLTLLAVSGGLWARQPEPVQKRRCELPPALEGMVGHVLVRYRVTDLGKVDRVEPVFAVADPADKTEAIVQSVSTCLKTWSYPSISSRSRAPSSVNEGPRASMEMLQAFHYFRPTLDDGKKVMLEDGRQVLAVHIEEMRSLKLELGKKLLAGPQLFESSGHGWVMQTNVRPKEREHLLKAVGFATQTFEQVFQDARPLPETSRLTLLVFGSEDQFNQVAAFDNLFRGPKLAGQYSAADEMAYTFASGMDHPLRHSVDYIVHETVHHLVFQRLARQGSQPPFWVNEGIASYVELLKPDKKGAFDKFEFTRGRQAQGAFTWVSKADGYLDAFQRDARAGGGIKGIGDFLQGRFESLNADQAYGRSWILTHYLINAEDGALMKPFQDWLTGLMGAQGDGGITAALGKTPEQLLSAMTEHVAAMKRGR